MPSKSDTSKSIDYEEINESSHDEGQQSSRSSDASRDSNSASLSSIGFKGLGQQIRRSIDLVKSETKSTIADVREQPSQFAEWSSEDLRFLLAEQGVSVRGGDSTSHGTLVKLCDALKLPCRPVVTKDSVKVEWAVRRIQKAYITSRTQERIENAKKRNEKRTNQSISSSSSGSNYNENLSDYLEELVSHMDRNDHCDAENDVIDGNGSRKRESTRHINPDTFRHASMLRRINNANDVDVDEDENDENDEELVVEWRKPSYRYAKRKDISSRPNRDGKPFDWKRITLGRHCTYNGCGEQFDLWDEGTTSELSQYGSGITNYFKFLKWSCWVMLLLAILHVPVLVINLLGGSMQYEANNAASTTFGNLGDADEVAIIDIPGCEPLPNIDNCSISKDRLAVLYSWLDAGCTTFVVVAWIWMMKFQTKESISLNRSTVTASDYTIAVRGIAEDTTEEELATHFRDIADGEVVAEVHLAFANSKEISLYFKRGKLMRKRYNCVQRIRYEKTKERQLISESNENDCNRDASLSRINKKLAKLLAERRILTAKIRLADEEREKVVKECHQSKAIQAFVTYRSEEALIKAISAYNQINWVQSMGCFYPKRLLLRGKKLRVTPAPEPSTIKWENLEYSSTSRFFRQLLTAAIAMLATCISVYCTFKSRDFQAKTLEMSSQPCPGGYYGLRIELQKEIVENDIALAHCFCATLGISEQWGFSICNDYLTMKIKSNVINYGAGFLVVFMNMAFTILFDRSASFEKHESQETAERSVMARVFVLKVINSGCLVLLYNQIWLQNIINIHFEKTPHEFNVSWYATGGVSLIIVMSLNAVTPHILPLVRYLMHRSKVNKLERNLTKEMDTKDDYKVFYTQEDLNKYVGSSAKFCLNYRYSQLLIVWYICFIYGLAIPVLLVIGSVSFFISYWLDKFLFCNFYATPPMYSDTMGKTCANLIGLSVPLHLVVSMWSMGTRDKIFDGLDSLWHNPPDIDMGVLTTLLRQATGKRHLLILEGMLLIYIAGVILNRFSKGLGKGMMRLLHMCFCRATSNQTKMLKQSMNTVQIDYHSAINRGIMKGLTSYNILKHPVYQDAFGISPEFADSHRRLSSIRGLNTKEGMDLI